MQPPDWVYGISIGVIGVVLYIMMMMTPTIKDLNRVEQEIRVEMAETDQELLDLIERQTEVIRDQAKDIRDLRLKQLELEYKHD